MRKNASNQIKMDVLLVCYNQEQYIEQTLNGILAQKTTGFGYRVIVADDASQDNTINKIKTIAEKSDIEFKFLSSEINHGITQNYKRAFSTCTSTYIAVIEGDDLWTDPLRLQHHYDFLEEHNECAMSFNCYEVRNFETGGSNIQPLVSKAEPFVLFTGDDLAYDNFIGNFSTCVYRKDIIKRLPEELYTWEGYDWIFNLLISRMGYIGCLPKVMNIYRIHDHGIWSGQEQETKIRGMLRIIDDYDKKLDGIYHDSFMAHKTRLQGMIEPKVKRKLKRAAAICYKKWKKLSYYLPPIIVVVIKLFVPPIIIDKLRRQI